MLALEVRDSPFPPIRLDSPFFAAFELYPPFHKLALVLFFYQRISSCDSHSSTPSRRVRSSRGIVVTGLGRVGGDNNDNEYLHCNMQS
mmetsp:Transcript_25563/g.47663  ORF Transcript_25563/g.47663 Transcript_25563/m.47663 type:complete len:88 (+) Transcript_25563:1195-1458(+)